jgi:RecB family endonuclease NucS
MRFQNPSSPNERLVLTIGRKKYMILRPNTSAKPLIWQPNGRKYTEEGIQDAIRNSPQNSFYSPLALRT